MNKPFPKIVLSLEIALMTVVTIYIYSQIHQYSTFLMDVFVATPVFLVALVAASFAAFSLGVALIRRLNGVLWTGTTAIKFAGGLVLIVIGVSLLMSVLAGAGAFYVLNR